MTQIAKDQAGHLIPVLRAGTVQSAAYTGTAGTTNGVGGTTAVVRVWCSTDAYVAFGPSASATASHTPVSAKQAEYFAVRAGDKVSAVQQSAGGTLYVTEMR